jgi:outer membrane immunogenic protein
MNARATVIGLAMLLVGPAAAWAQDRSGVYVGAHAGSAWGRFEYVEPDDPDAGIDVDVQGFLGGFIAGYERQASGLVLGIEGDIGGGSLKLEAGDDESNDYSAAALDWNGRLRGRIGHARERVAPFVAIGVALAGITLDDIDAGFGDDKATHVGLTVGGGLDYALTSRLLVRAEYLYDHYGENDYAISSPPGPFFPSYDAEIDLSAHVVRAAVTVRF